MKKIKYIFVCLMLAVSILSASAIKGGGGPDAFGYYWIDSNSLEGPAYSWIDISSTGTKLNLSGDDISDFINLGFDFNFYGSIYDSLKVYSWGMLSFDGPSNNNYPASIPGENYTIIAPFWAPLDLDQSGEVHYLADSVNDRFIVQFDSVPEAWEPESRYSFQAILNSDGSILFQYKDIIGYKDICSIGIQNSSGSTGLGISYYDNYVEENLAVLFDITEQSVGGEIELSSSSLSYGSVTVFEQSVSELTIFNRSINQILSGDITSLTGFTILGSPEFELSPDTNQKFYIEFYPQSNQSYSGYLVINSSDPANPVDSVFVSGTGVYPDINVSAPDTLTADLFLGTSVNENLTIVNSGTGNLEFSTRLILSGKGSGGPDNFGYTWKDSDSVDGPAYFWRDISYAGTLLNLGDEQVTSPINIGFDFDYYGNTYNSLIISSNGFVSFTSNSSAPINYQIPAPLSEPYNHLAAFWDDLDPSSGGQVFYHYDAVFKRFIIQYKDVPRAGGENGNTFQIILYSDNSIVYQYKKLGNILNSCTVGIENSNGTDGIQVVYNQNYLKNDLAILFTPPHSGWAKAEPVRSNLTGNDSLEVSIQFDTSGLSGGLYYTSLVIDSTDPDTPSVTIPLKLKVTEELETPLNVVSSVSGGNITLSWSPVQFATGYKIYSSSDPYGTFTEDTGTFTGETTWTASAADTKKFYRVTATTASK